MSTSDASDATAHTASLRPYDVAIERTPATAINVRLDASENMRSRRAGTSMEWRIWTQRKSSARGIWTSATE